MNKNIEEAIIVATFEHEVKIPVETVVAEPLQTKQKKRNRGLLSELFDIFDIFDLFSEPEEEEYFENFEDDPTPSYTEPELAVITETYEQRIEEIHFAYYEFID